MLSGLKVAVNNTIFAKIIVFSMLNLPPPTPKCGEIPVTQRCSSMSKNHLTFQLFFFFFGFNSNLEQVMEEHPCGQHLPSQPCFCTGGGKILFPAAFWVETQSFLHFSPLSSTPSARHPAVCFSSPRFSSNYVDFLQPTPLLASLLGGIFLFIIISPNSCQHFQLLSPLPCNCLSVMAAKQLR